MLNRYIATQFKLLVGTNDIDYGGNWYQVEQTIVHASYQMGDLAGDIGLLKTSQNIQFNAKVQPISVALSGDLSGCRAQKSGWDEHNDLKMTDLSVVSDARCQKVFGPTYSNKNLCAIPRQRIGFCEVGQCRIKTSGALCKNFRPFL